MKTNLTNEELESLHQDFQEQIGMYLPLKNFKAIVRKSKKISRELLENSFNLNGLKYDLDISFMLLDLVSMYLINKPWISVDISKDNIYKVNKAATKFFEDLEQAVTKKKGCWYTPTGQLVIDRAHKTLIPTTNLDEACSKLATVFLHLTEPDRMSMLDELNKVLDKYVSNNIPRFINNTTPITIGGITISG